MSISGHRGPGSTRQSNFTMDLGAVVEFSRFRFEQFEIRDTETEAVCATSTEVCGTQPRNLTWYFRKSSLEGKKLVCKDTMIGYSNN
jgi:hypothetical protein